MATALATMEYIEQNNLPENAATQGAVLRKNLEDLQAEFNFIGDVRGMGLMQALELVQPGTDREPDGVRAAELMDAAREQGLLIGKSGLYGNVLRVAPHLNVSADQIEAGSQMLAKALAAIG
jgi:4-aminobutyrate aminotransferase-like enzyme